MRAGLLSQDWVIETLNANFVSATRDFEPGGFKRPLVDDAQLAKETDSSNGYAARAVYHLFALPDGTAIHHLPGYWKPEVFKQEMDFVLSIKKDILDKVTDVKERDRLIRERHAKHAETHKSTEGLDLIIGLHRQHASKPLPTIDHLHKMAEKRIKYAMTGRELKDEWEF